VKRGSRFKVIYKIVIIILLPFLLISLAIYVINKDINGLYSTIIFLSLIILSALLYHRAKKKQPPVLNHWIIDI